MISHFKVSFLKKFLNSNERCVDPILWAYTYRKCNDKTVKNVLYWGVKLDPCFELFLSFFLNIGIYWTDFAYIFVGQPPPWIGDMSP